MESGPETSPESRRPLKSRSTQWAAFLSSALARLGVAPNLISAGSMVFAAAGGVLLAVAGMFPDGWRWGAWCGAAACIQLRLVCNLMDGMVAVEQGRRTPTGELWNEIPDRVADVLILTGAGVAAGRPEIGALLACGAIGTAYLRAFGASLTGKQDFRGPMAKPHRMAVLTVACLAAAAAPLLAVSPALIIEAALWLIAAGLFVTCWRRTAHLAHELERR